MPGTELELDAKTGANIGSCFDAREALSLWEASVLQAFSRVNLFLIFPCSYHCHQWGNFPVGNSQSRLQKWGKCSCEGVWSNQGVYHPVAISSWQRVVGSARVYFKGILAEDGAAIILVSLLCTVSSFLITFSWTGAHIQDGVLLMLCTGAKLCLFLKSIHLLNTRTYFALLAVLQSNHQKVLAYTVCDLYCRVKMGNLLLFFQHVKEGYFSPCFLNKTHLLPLQNSTPCKHFVSNGLLCGRQLWGANLRCSRLLCWYATWSSCTGLQEIQRIKGEHNFYQDSWKLSL